MSPVYTPRVIRVPEYVDPARKAWCVTGTAYGYLHRTDGGIRTWRSRSGAYRAAKRYAPL